MTHPTADAAIAASRANGGTPEWCESTPENYHRLVVKARDAFVNGPTHDPHVIYYGKIHPDGRRTWSVRIRLPVPRSKVNP